MRDTYRWCLKTLLLGMLVTTYACSSGDGGTESVVDQTVNDSVQDTGLEGLDPSLFVSGALSASVTTEACTLSGGTETDCYRIEIPGVPADRVIGPFCPPTIFSDASAGGIWFDGGGDVYDIDGDFIVNLVNLYGDQNWQLYDQATGDVNVTDTQVACEAAARPNVDPQYQNHCVECAIEYYGGGVSQTFLIPVTPVPMATSGNIGGDDLGVTLDGVVLAPPAPVQAILGAYTIAAFDDCGGHVNPVEGYHYHGATGCTEVVRQDDGHAALMGYTLDGYALHGMLNEDGSEPTDLDGCRGHTDDVRGYHYHAASAGENMFIGCFRGEQGMVL
tara:strand:+ start:4416 stop:5411 length:996 start_codon:yes stop_codon:yes gene_type:complete